MFLYHTEVFFMKIKIGIVGYGNLGRGVESAVTNSADMELVALFTRRDPESITTKTNLPVYHIDNILDMKLLYVALTRALHELEVTFSSDISDVLK
jgi:dihydrodipicolinate reductase